LKRIIQKIFKQLFDNSAVWVPVIATVKLLFRQVSGFPFCLFLEAIFVHYVMF